MHSRVHFSAMQDGKFTLLMTGGAVLVVLTLLMGKGQNVLFIMSFVRLLLVRREFPL